MLDVAKEFRWADLPEAQARVAKPFSEFAAFLMQSLPKGAARDYCLSQLSDARYAAIVAVENSEPIDAVVGVGG